MKVKGFISALLATAMFAGAGAAVFAEGAYVSDTNDKEIVITSDSDMKAKAIVADYDVNGRFVNAFTKLVDVASGDNTYTYADLGVSGINAQRKVMLWNEDGIEPIGISDEVITDMDGYLTACVDAVDMVDNKAYIWFDVSSRDESELVISAEKTCNITLGGEPISVEEIKSGDVLTIKCVEDEWLEDMDEYEIIVTRTTADGVVAVHDTYDNIYILEDGRKYVGTNLIPGRLELGTNYRLYFDAFGRIVNAEEIVDYGNVAVVDDLYSTADGYTVKLLLAAGGSERYTISKDIYDELYDVLYFMEGEKNSAHDRVISYSITEDGSFELLQEIDDIGGNVMMYSPETSVGLKNSKVIMADEDDYVDIIYPEMLIEGKKYKVWYFGANAGNTYELAIVQTVQEIDNKMPMAVFVSSKVAEIPGEGEMNCITAYIDGEMKELYTNLDVDFASGDIFFFLKNADGIVTTIEPILKESMPETYTELYNKALDSNFDMLNADTVNEFIANSEDESDIIFGAIIDDESGSVYVATKDTVTDMSAVDIDRNTEDYDIADDVRVHKYDYDYHRAKDRVSATSAAALRATTFPKAAYADEDYEIINLRSDVLLSENNENYGKVNFAVLKIVDDEVVEALVITPSSTKN